MEICTDKTRDYNDSWITDISHCHLVVPWVTKSCTSRQNRDRMASLRLISHGSNHWPVNSWREWVTEFKHVIMECMYLAVLLFFEKNHPNYNQSQVWVQGWVFVDGADLQTQQKWQLIFILRLHKYRVTTPVAQHQWDVRWNYAIVSTY